MSDLQSTRTPSLPRRDMPAPIVAARPLRLQVLGDLHGTLAKGVARLASHVDVVVCAGDLTSSPRATFEALRDAFLSTTRIVCVLGDMEYRGQAHEDILDAARCLAPSFGIDLLQDSASIIHGIRFVGATLWTDFRLNGEHHDNVNAAIDAADAGLLEAARMRWRNGHPFTGYSTLFPHWYSRQWIERELRRPFDGPTVVVTHHAPSARSLPESFRLHPLAPAHASPAEETVGRSGAAVWVHGSVQIPCDHMIGATRVVSNPGGVRDHFGEDADLQLVVEVGRAVT